MTDRKHAKSARIGLRCGLNVVAICGLLLAQPVAAETVDTKPPIASAISPREADRVMALVSPWADGAEVLPGIHFTGASIDLEIACYLFESKRPIEACLLPQVGARAMPSDHRRPLPHGVSLVLRAPAAPSPDELALLTALQDIVTQNAMTHDLDALWHAPKLRQRGLLRVVDPTAPWARVLGVAQDPILWLGLLLLWLLAASRASIADLPYRGWPQFAALLGFSAFTRWTLPIDAPMTAWSWTRLTTIGTQLDTSALVGMIMAKFPDSLLTLDALQSDSARVLSLVTPLALLGHGRKLFGSSRAALAAAFLLAASPHALRFAASDTQFNTSMFWSSVAFFWVYCALESTRTWTRLAYAIGLVPLLVMAMTARPLNLAYGPLMITALWIATQRDQIRWRLLLGAEVAAVFAWAGLELVLQNSDSVQSAIHVDALWGAFELLLSPSYNPLLFWRLTPPLWTLLIGIGAVAMIRGPWSSLEPTIARRRGIWLVCWLLGYIALHGVVVVEEPMNNARYQLHSLPAMAMLAGAGLWALWLAWQHKDKRYQGAVALIALLCLAAPWLHRDSIEDVGFATMQERLLLRDMAEAAATDGPIPKECTIIEVMRPLAGQPVSKTQRAGRLVQIESPTGAARQIWKHVDVQHWTEHTLTPDGREIPAAAGSGVPEQQAPEQQAPEQQAPEQQTPAAVAAPHAAANKPPNGSTLANLAGSLLAARSETEELHPEFAQISERGRALLANPPSCLVFFESADCALAPHSTARHPACEEILASGPWEMIAERRTTTRIYDMGLMVHLRANGDPLELRLWRRVHRPSDRQPHGTPDNALRNASPPTP